MISTLRQKAGGAFCLSVEKREKSIAFSYAIKNKGCLLCI